MTFSAILVTGPRHAHQDLIFLIGSCRMGSFFQKLRCAGRRAGGAFGHHPDLGRAGEIYAAISVERDVAKELQKASIAGHPACGDFRRCSRNARLRRLNLICKLAAPSVIQALILIVVVFFPLRFGAHSARLFKFLVGVEVEELCG
jgi:hypothetical protein